ncbi:uncharacterized protein PAC_08353 [Phialocephala subalpina]|uniref:Uncharacterized protein n=1 Tax=Phialocephala subalpina TaxID=576137 RepID=A0A1L7X0B3_9HELO|nr:uncharacterized protein PAC_08353 [Phialocephala subalpina]
MRLWSELWDPFGVVRFVSRIIQDDIETQDTTNESNWSHDEDNDDDNDDAEDVRTDRAFLEFEAKTLEHNLTQREGAAYAIDDLNRYCEQQFMRVNSHYDISATNSHSDKSLLAALQSAVEHGRRPQAQDLLGLRNSQERQTAIEQFTTANREMEAISPFSGKSVTPNTDTARNSLIREHSSYLYSHLEREFSRAGCGPYHEVMLQLSGFEESRNQISVPNFELFISPCLPSISWHETHCAMTEDECLLDEAERETICVAIEQYSKFKRLLHVSFGQGRLWISPKKQNLTWGHAVPRVSLRQLLDAGAFSDGDSFSAFTRADKYLLVLNLARCFFYLYDGPWGPADWNADHIFFLNKTETDIIHGRHIPYICYALPNQTRNRALEARPGEICPPVLLSFARLLLEIERGGVLPPVGARNQDLYDQLQTIVEHELRGQIAVAYRAAVIGCLEFVFDLGMAPGTNMEMKVRHIILWNIVENLRKHYSDWKSPMPDNADLRFVSRPSKAERQTGITTTSSYSELKGKAPSLHYNSCTVSEVLAQDIKTNTLPRIHTWTSTLTLFDDIKISTDIDSGYCKVFMENMKNFHQQYIVPLSGVSEDTCPPPQVREDRIRIAVLDTGILGADNLIRAAKARIRGYWSPRQLGRAKPDDCEDFYGHGTHVVRLLLNVAPSADVFIAKISEGKDMAESEVHHIADAIRWATDECDAHIITMSFGLDIRPGAVTKAIKAAIDRGKLVFAAASNSGGNLPRAYPASLTGVICVHATDGMGNQASFNPSRERGNDNFATLGNGIESRWKRETVIKSGTSFATPIAAGIAANVLEFARHHLTEIYDRNKYERLCSYSGMRQMFICMSSPRGDYDYVSPWKIFPQQKAGRGQVEDHIKEICDNIRMLLNTDKVPEIWNSASSMKLEDSHITRGVPELSLRLLSFYHLGLG